MFRDEKLETMKPNTLQLEYFMLTFITSVVYEIYKSLHIENHMLLENL